LAVSLNAGLWQRTVSKSGQRSWQQLKGPRYALSIAVDASNPWHLAVGERNSDAQEVRLNEAGLWESYDKGATWTYSFNPLQLQDPASAPGTPCPSQAIPSLVFSSGSSLIAATGCGIVRRDKNGGTFSPAVLPAQLRGGQSIVASLRSSDGKVVSGRRVSVRILGPNGNTLFWSPGLLLDGAGRVRVLIYPLPGLTVHIHFSSTEDTGLAGSEIHFAY
jgi:hypothetical protein